MMLSLFINGQGSSICNKKDKLIMKNFANYVLFCWHDMFQLFFGKQKLIIFYDKIQNDREFCIIVKLEAFNN